MVGCGRVGFIVPLVRQKTERGGKKGGRGYELGGEKENLLANPAESGEKLGKHAGNHSDARKGKKSSCGIITVGKFE